MLYSWLKGLICTPRPDVFLTDISLFDWIHCFYMLLVAGSYDVIKHKSILPCRPIYIYIYIYESHSICHRNNYLGKKFCNIGNVLKHMPCNCKCYNQMWISVQEPVAGGRENHIF